MPVNSLKNFNALGRIIAIAVGLGGIVFCMCSLIIWAIFKG